MNIKEKVKKSLKKIDDSKEYTTGDIRDLGVIIDTNGKPSLWVVLRLIKSKKLPARDMSAGAKIARYMVNGKDLKEYLKKVYAL